MRMIERRIAQMKMDDRLFCFSSAESVRALVRAYDCKSQ